MARWFALLGITLSLAGGWLLAQDAGLNNVDQTQNSYSVPEPSVVPLGWELDMTYKSPMRLVAPDSQGNETYYWYFLYTVSNPKDHEVFFLPRVQLLTDKLELVDAEMAMPLDLFRKIKTLHKAKYLEDPLAVSGPLFTAYDNARDSVAVFALKGDPTSFRIIFSGLSGEQQELVRPNGKPVVMEKVRVMDFRVPGHTPADQLPKVIAEGDEWLLRPAPPKAAMNVDLSKAAAGRLDEVITVNGVPLRQKPPTTQPE